MKNKVMFIGLLAMLAFGLVLAGCASTPAVPVTAADLSGTWAHENKTGSENLQFTFTGSNFVYKWDSGSIEGSFVIDGKAITFTASGHQDWKTNFTLKNNKLTLPSGPGVDGGWWWYGAFNKQ
ncbi:MAG: hypothetical protein LBM77_02260 [Spirochaetaceae bacterium]|nr:hypothetical protein [Spirochaetaceae bacterium]